MKQRAALAVLQNRRPSAELAALAELSALVDVLIEDGAIDGTHTSYAALTAFEEAHERGKALVAERMAARVADTDACERCGCTWFHACPGGCYWVRPGLCSRCAEAA